MKYKKTPIKLYLITGVICNAFAHDFRINGLPGQNLYLYLKIFFTRPFSIKT